MHTSIAGGLALSVDRAAELGCDSMQIFGRNPRSWGFLPVSPTDVSLFRKRRTIAGIWPVVIHTTYLINLSSPDDANYEKSVDLFKNELMTAEDLGADYLVTHLGSPHELGPEFAVERIEDALAATAKSPYGKKTMILFENTAGAGNSFGSDLAALGGLIERALGLGLPAGICFDTCHAFAAGYPMKTACDIGGLVKTIERDVGLENLKVIHLNDSKGEFGSNLDRHEHIGKGKIGLEAFKRLLTRPGIRDVPMILETPKKTPQDDPRNLRVVREILKERKKKK
ncbi:MAG: deoxyribonuclease IV [Deltaproteobacteria bacterium]|nr:deoxyribonuclease IV [Deltaproteobacteria bacterium]